ncbi:MAG: nitrous oxide-stimulated promoter family protein [Gammaproteobacteria bacterium]
MFTQEKRLARELFTITKMTEMYCSAHHDDSDDGICPECAEFVDYIGVRLKKCPYAEGKPTCDNCPIHCYKRARQEQGRAIMIYSGPRMLLRHPLLTIAHQLDGFIKVRHPRELTREERLRSRNR